MFEDDMFFVELEGKILTDIQGDVGDDEMIFTTSDGKTAMLTFLTETKNGEFGVISTTASQLPRIEVRREDAAEPVYYYSFQ